MIKDGECTLGLLPVSEKWRPGQSVRVACTHREKHGGFVLNSRMTCQSWLRERIAELKKIPRRVGKTLTKPALFLGSEGKPWGRPENV